MGSLTNVEPLTIFYYLVAVYAACFVLTGFVFSEADESNGTDFSRLFWGWGGREEVQVGHPRILAYYFGDADASLLTLPSTRRLPADATFYYPPKRTVRWTNSDERGRKLLLNSVPFTNEDHRALKPYQDFPECVPMHDWQTKSFPACNDIHQVDLSDLSYSRNRLHRQVRIIAHGYFRDVWAVREHDGLTLQVLKTIRYEHDFDEWNFDRHRMDAIAYERLTSSPRVMDIYGFCGHSALFEHAPGGDISEILFDYDEKPSTKERFEMAVQVAQAIRDLHNFNDKVPAIAHADIMTNQFVKVGEYYKLSDFNRCTFLYWNSTSNDGSCPYYYGDYNAWLFRSPEEYFYSLQSEKIDIYSMGNIFYTLMMNKWPFADLYDKDGTSAVRKQVRAGHRPPMSSRLQNSQDPRIKAMIKAMDMCYVQDWRKRATAKEVADFLTTAKKEIETREKEPDNDSKW